MAVVYFIQQPLFLMNSEITAEMCDATEADIKNVCMAHKKIPPEREISLYEFE